MSLIVCAVVAGCGAAPSMYSYRVITEDCNCDEFRKADGKNNIEYVFRASYTMDHGISTTINVLLLNKSRDTLFLDGGTVRISSRNVSYQYNDRFVPLPHLIIPPFSSDFVRMTGKTEAEAIADLTRGVPMKRVAEIDEVVEVILFAADPKNSFMTGHALAVDGGIAAV